jgi:hypothetical protein
MGFLAGINGTPFERKHKCISKGREILWATRFFLIKEENLKLSIILLQPARDRGDRDGIF